MTEPRRRPALLGIVVVPLALAPLILAAVLNGENSFLILALLICFAAPASGFWLGEMIGTTGPTRAGLGCLATAGFFILDCAWVFALAPRIFDR